MCPKAAAFLEAQGSTRLAVVSIAGDTRCGKSYLLNRLAKTPNGFGVSSLSDPCTHGLWLLPRAVQSSASGEDCAVLFLDSEGTASFETTTQVSSALVSLAGLISSVLLVNQMLAINSHCISGLFNAACILQSLCSDESTACSVPHLLLVIRDHRLSFEGSPTTELETKHLADMDLRGAAPAEMSARMAANATRGLIKSVLNCRSCCALTTPHAGNGRAIQNAGDNELSQEFLQAAIAAVNIDRDGLIRSLGSVWRSVIAAELDKAKVAAASCYSAAAEGLGSCSSVEEAEALHKEALSSALCMFNTAASSCSTDDDQREKLAAWVSFAAGVKPSLQLVCERIMRREAEAALALRDCVQQAKACVLEEVDLQELLQAMAGCGSTDAAGDVFEAKHAATMSVLEGAIAAAAADINTASNNPTLADLSAVAQAELAAAMAAARTAGLQACEGRLAAAAHAQLQQGLQAKEAAIQSYKQGTQELEDFCNALDGLREAHQDVLA
ncbi:hypothetical protein OEZ86_009644 [Tetradesmus obliquus]|uniref:Guanylate-binding protein N-terminal domain-containing protein n=1 Tax=Tetradesmus obliquus TaxID=3088 RepID=A0ABY8UN49_TETOB|nr:hypothetical protein OEZ85_001088 [Tetradesmus obliquus]WIA43129.1 hypothetical protein OEZ86_009644 [Tetradesmus obliquus]